MPFPLAHPAAVLPLRRLCPKYLSFPALVMGTLSPDAGYLLDTSWLQEMSHSFPAGLCFGLVVGLAMLLIYFQLGHVAMKLSSVRCRSTISSICQQARDSFRVQRIGVASISVLIGTATHLVLDGFTHAGGWFVLHSSFLQAPMLTIHSHQVRICHFLWYAASFVGIAWLVIAFQNWRERVVPGTAPSSMRSRVFAGLLAATLVVPIEIAHHMVRSRLGLLLVTLLSVVLAIAAMLWMTGTGAKARSNSSHEPAKFS